MTARHTRRDVPPHSLGLCGPTMQLLPQHFLMAAAPHFGFDGAYFVKKCFLHRFLTGALEVPRVPPSSKGVIMTSDTPCVPSGFWAATGAVADEAEKGAQKLCLTLLTLPTDNTVP